MTAFVAFLVAATLLFASASSLLAFVSTHVRAGVLPQLSSPGLRADVAWLLGVAPSVLALLFVVGAAAPSIPSLAGLDRDHCLDHGGHGHFCPIHAPSAPWTATVVAGGIVLWTLTRAVRLLHAERRASRSLDALERVGRRSGVEIWVPGAARLCHAAGWWNPRILVSEHLRSSVPVAELNAALAHERAHLRRRDPLALIALRVVGIFTPVPLARAAEADFRAAAEEAADAAAAHAVGDGTVVAGALVTLTRMSLSAPALAAAEGNVERRVRALLANPRGEARRSRVVALGTALGLFVVGIPFAGTGETHHVVGLHAVVELGVEAVMHRMPGAPSDEVGTSSPG